VCLGCARVHGSAAGGPLLYTPAKNCPPWHQGTVPIPTYHCVKVTSSLLSKYTEIFPWNTGEKLPTLTSRYSSDDTYYLKLAHLDIKGTVPMPTHHSVKVTSSLLTKYQVSHWCNREKLPTLTSRYSSNATYYMYSKHAHLDIKVQFRCPPITALKSLAHYKQSTPRYLLDSSLQTKYTEISPWYTYEKLPT
jgi:hypothetical protein